MSDRLHFVRQFITVSRTCSESNSSAKDLHADGLCLARIYTLVAEARVCASGVRARARTLERNKSSAGVTTEQRTINVSGLYARGFVTAKTNRARGRARSAGIVFFYSASRHNNGRRLDLSLLRSGNEKETPRGL